MGCGVDVNQDYSPLTANSHPFAAPAEVHHDEWLRAHGYDIGQCTACHGTNFDGNGNQTMSCGNCHRDAGRVTVTDCNFCHGTRGSGIDRNLPRNWAPPSDLAGNVSRSNRGIGAHQVHFSSQPPILPLPCSGCHIVPSRWDSPGHLGTGNAEVVGVGWDETTLTCTACHGASNHIWNQ